MPAPASDHLDARIFLRAVLPALSVYVERDEAARRAVKDWRFALRFASTSGVATTLAFRDGTLSVDPPRAGFALRLLFLSDRDVVRVFRREGTPRVLPWGGLHHLVRLPALSDLLARMGETLGSPAPESGRPEGQALRVALVFGALLPAAAAELAGHDATCRRLLAPFGDFTAQLAVPRVADGWIARRGTRVAWGRGRSPFPADVRIAFRDPEVALSAMHGLIDPLAASVTGEISVRGMIPLADALAQVMDRVNAHLEPSPSGLRRRD